MLSVAYQIIFLSKPFFALSYLSTIFTRTIDCVDIKESYVLKLKG